MNSFWLFILAENQNCCGSGFCGFQRMASTVMKVVAAISSTENKR
jgi:hypothetical protein